MAAYYNELDPYAAQWLRNLIAAGRIADGVVDERSIADVYPIELREFTQCHFFAGVGVWSLALRMAGWPDDRRVWTGSCPCQPFSSAGRGGGFADERHLWPAWHHLIAECRPPVVFGEQVASKGSEPWLDLVQDDLEALGYAVGAIPFPSAGVGAPHIRYRLYFAARNCSERCRVGDTAGPRPQRCEPARQRPDAQREATERAGAAGAAGGVVDVWRNGDRSAEGLPDQGAPQADRPTDQFGRSGLSSGELAHDDDAGLQRFAGLRLRGARFHDADGRSPVGGFWADADWIPCRDNRWRPVEPGAFPLAHGAPARVGRLRAYGNAINAEAARVFVEAFLDTEIA